jgi:hypothetical protein
MVWAGTGSLCTILSGITFAVVCGVGAEQAFKNAMHVVARHHASHWVSMNRLGMDRRWFTAL